MHSGILVYPSSKHYIWGLSWMMFLVFLSILQRTMRCSFGSWLFHFLRLQGHLHTFEFFGIATRLKWIPAYCCCLLTLKFASCLNFRTSLRSDPCALPCTPLMSRCLHKLGLSSGQVLGWMEFWNETIKEAERDVHGKATISGQRRKIYCILSGQSSWKQL